MAKLDLDVLTIKTGTTADIKMSDKVLQKGELLVDTNSGNPQLYVGDGTTKVKNLKAIADIRILSTFATAIERDSNERMK